MFTSPNSALRILANGFLLATKVPSASAMVFDLSETGAQRPTALQRFNGKLQEFWRDQNADMAARHLRVLDDRILGDIGISRGQIGAAVHGGRAALQRS